MAEASVRNSQIWSASLCRDKYIPEFIRVQGSNLKPETLRTLQYQIENDQWYQVEGLPEADNTPEKDLKGMAGSRSQNQVVHTARSSVSDRRRRTGMAVENAKVNRRIQHAL